MLTGYLSTLPTDCLLSAGVLYCRLASGAVVALGVTDGAPDFDPGVEEAEIMFDNRAPGRLKGLSRRVGFSPVFKGVLKEFGPAASGNQIASLEPESVESPADGSGTKLVTPKGTSSLISAGAYISELRWIFERASGGYACLYAPLAVVRKWTHKGNDKKEAAISFEIEAIGDPASDLGTAPFVVEIRTQVPKSLAETLSVNFGNPAERATPALFTSSGRTDGFTDRVPIRQGSTLFSSIRVTYPRTDTSWATATLAENCGDSTNAPQIHLANQSLASVAGPVPDSSVFDVAFLPGFNSSSYAGYGVTVTQPANDNQDVTDFRRGAYLGVAARSYADVGTKVYVELADITTDPSTPAVFVGPVMVQLRLDYQYPGLDLDTYAHLTNLSIIVRPAFNETANVATGVRVLANSLGIARVPSVDGEKPRLNAFHSTLGLLSQFQHQNCWAESAISLGGGATSAASAANAPDSSNYFSGHKLTTYTLPASANITASGAAHVEQVNASPSNQPPKAIWLHIYAPDLADSSLQSYVTAASGPTWGPITMRKDRWGFHRGRLSLGVGGGIASMVDNGDGSMTVTTVSAHGLSNGQNVDLNGKVAGVQHVPYNNLLVSAVTSTTFKVPSAGIAQLLDAGGEVIPRYLNFTPKIQNNGTGTIGFDATRLAMTCEEDRNQGRHNAIIPARALTAPCYSDAAFTIIRDSAALITRPEGVWGIRFVPTDTAENIAAWLGDSPELWQNGPGGSDDYNWAAGVRNSPTFPGSPEIYVTMNRGAGFPGYASFAAAFTLPTGYLQPYVAVDLFVAWKAGAIVALGIGTGVGTSITWLTNGMNTFGPHAVSITSTAGTAWNLQDAGTIGSLARRVGLLADRDFTREFPGFLQAIVTANTVDTASVQDSIQSVIRSRLGARQSY